MENRLPPLPPEIISTDSQPPQRIQFSPHGYGYASRNDINLRYYWGVILKRKWWIILSFFSMVITTGIYSFLATPIYQASTTLQITQDNPAAASLLGDRDPFAALFASETQGRFYETQYMLLNSRTMAYKIMDALNLCNSKEFIKFRKNNPQKSLEELRSKFAKLLLSNLSVQPLKRSFLVQVTFTWPDKVVAQQVVQVISQEFMKFCMDTRRQSYELIKDWLEVELRQLADKVEESEKKVYENGKEKGFLAIETNKDNATLKKYQELNLLLTRAQSERMLKEANFNQIKEHGIDAPLITNNSLIQRLREEAISQESKVSSLNKVYDKNYPPLQAERGKLQELKQSLGEEVKRISNSIKSDYEAAVKTEDLLHEAYESQKGQVGALQDNLVTHHILKRDMQTNEQLYQGLLARMKETSVASTMVSSNVAVIEPPEIPYYPYKPKKLMNLMIASALGLAGGIGLAFLAEYFDDSIKTSNDMESACNSPVLGVVPLSEPGRKEPLVAPGVGLAVLHQPNAWITEAIRQVRTSVMLSSIGGPPVALVVSSPNPNDGKTTIAVNMAVALAMNGRKVALLDGDLRKPAVHKAFQLPGEPGLSNYLTGGATLSEVLHPTEVNGLYVMPAGTRPPNPTELLDSRNFQELLTDLRKEFQHVLIDTPPLIEFADARILASTVDGVLLVCKYHNTTRESARLSKELLDQVNARVIGTILNMATTDRLGYYTGSYYYRTYYYRRYLSYQKGDPTDN